MTAAREWLASRGLDVAIDEAPARTTRQRVRGSGSAPVGAKSSGSGSAGPGSAGPAFSDAEPSNLDPAEEEARARSLVLRKLGAQARTRHELGQALRAKDVPADIADQVLDRMEDVGLVDDATFAGRPLAPGDRVALGWDPAAAHRLDA